MNSISDSKFDLQTINLNSDRTCSKEDIFEKNCCNLFYCKKVEMINDNPAIVYYICCFKIKYLFYIP